VSRGLGLVETSAAAARHRVDRAPGGRAGGGGAGAGGGAGPPTPTRYGGLWAPSTEPEAMSLILNTSDTEGFEAAGEANAERLAPFIDRSATVLDLGCGIGRVARYLAPRCGTLWAVDASTRMLELAADRLAAFDNVRLARCVDTSIPDVATSSVDVAYSILVLQHVEREDAFLLLQELHRVLKPTGVAVVTFPNLLSAQYLASFLDYARTGQVANPARARMYTPQEVERLLPAAGFDVEVEADIELWAVCRPRTAPA